MSSSMGVSRTRLRQIALVAKDLEKAKHLLVRRKALRRVIYECLTENAKLNIDTHSRDRSHLHRQCSREMGSEELLRYYKDYY